MSGPVDRLADGSIGRMGEAKAEVAWRERQLVVTRCLSCNRVHRGTVVEGREWHEAHRRERHPELAAVGRRSMRRQRSDAIKESEWKRERWGTTPPPRGGFE